MSKLDFDEDFQKNHPIFVEVLSTCVSFIDADDSDHKESINKVISYLYNNPFMSTTWYGLMFGYATIFVGFNLALSTITDFNSPVACMLNFIFRILQVYIIIVLINTFFIRPTIKLCAMSDIKISELNIGELRLEPALKI
jgi:uncharacterized membrane protein YesL